MLLPLEEPTGPSLPTEHARVGPVRVPYHTHDVGEDGAGGADERAHDGQQVVVEQEALGTQGPAGVAVQHRDDHRHVRSPDGSRQSHALGRKASAARSSENKK